MISIDKKRTLNIADFITLLNGILGFLAITYIIDGLYRISSILIVFSILIDGADGFIARKLNIEHELGCYLDLFSDTISFCFAPSLLLYSSYYNVTLGRAWESPINAFATFVPMVIVFFGVLRLSRFVDEDGHNSNYIGVPTPALALFIVLITYILGWGKLLAYFPILVLAIVLIVSLLLYSNIKYPKIRSAGLILIGLFILSTSIFSFLVPKDFGLIKNIFIGISLLGCTTYIIFGPFMVLKYDR